MVRLMKKLNPEAVLTVFISVSGETVELYLYENDQDDKPTFIASSGTLDDRDKIAWLAEVAAKGAGIAFTIEEVE